MNQLDRLTQNVKDTPDLRAATAKFCSNLAAEVLLTVGNESAATALHGTLTTHAAHLADCLLASTPMIVATHPIPDTTEDEEVAEDPQPEIKPVSGDPA